jgi:hypothetical protein
MFTYSLELIGYIILFIAVLPAVGIAWGRRGSRIDWFHPVTAITLYVGLMIGCRIFYVAEGYSRIVHDQFVLIQGLRLLALFFAASFVVARLARRSFRPRIYFTARGKRSEAVLFIALAVFAVGAGAVIVLIRDYGGLTLAESDVTAFMQRGFTGNWALLQGYELLHFAVLAVGLQWMLTRRRVLLAATCVLGAASMAISLTGGFRSYFFMPALYLLVAWGMLRGRGVAICGLAFLISIIVLAPVLNNIRFGGAGVYALEGDTSRLSENAPTGVVSALVNVSSRFICLDAQSRAFDLLLRGDVPVSWGRQIWEVPLTLVPRKIYPDKPVPGGVLMTDLFLSDVYPSGTGTVISLPVFLFWQFGWVGLLLSPVLFGVLLAWVAHWYETVERQFGNVFFYVVEFSVVYSLFAMDAGVVEHALIPFLLALPFIRVRWREKKPRVKWAASGRLRIKFFPGAGSPTPAVQVPAVREAEGG